MTKVQDAREAKRRFIKGVGSFVVGTAIGAPTFVRAQDSNRLRVAVGFGFPNLPVRIADKQGYFVEQAAKLGIPNLKVELVQLSGQNPILDAMMSGQIDMCISGPAGMLIAWDRTRGTRREIIGISGLSNNQCTLLTVDPRIRTLSDFRPTDKIAMPSTQNTQGFLLRMACAKQFNDPARLDTNMISLPHPDALNGMLRGGIVAAHFASPPYSQIIQADSRARKLLTSTEAFGGPSSFVIAAGSRSFATANPKMVQVFTSGLQDAVTFIKSKPAEATALFLSIEPSKVLRPAEYQAILEDPNEGYSLNASGIETYAKFMKQLGVLKTELKDVSEFMPPVVPGLRHA
jgi:NitT/TauT family transport system substrate-binding protein